MQPAINGATIHAPEDTGIENRHRNFADRSGITQEIISRRPDFLEKWALLLFTALLLLLLAGTWFIRYPDVIEASGTLTGSNTPKEIIPRQSGKLAGLRVNNNDQVIQGQIIGWIESTADVHEILSLSERLDTSLAMLLAGHSKSVSGLFEKRNTNLGELQAAYQSFITARQQYDDYLINGFYDNRKKKIFNDIKIIEAIKQQTGIQKNIARKDEELARKAFEMKEYLYQEKVISKDEYLTASSQYLNKEMAIPQLESSVFSHQSQLNDKQKEIDQLDHDISQQKKIFEQALTTLKSNVDEWVSKYVIKAPAAGKITFAIPLQSNQYIQQDKLLGYVNPENSTYRVQLRLNQNNFGKTDTGMKVHLWFEAYPYQESGFVAGTLDYISTIAVDSVFLATVRLENGLRTNYKKDIQYKNGLKVKAMIITKDMRLLERFYYNTLRPVSLNK